MSNPQKPSAETVQTLFNRIAPVYDQFNDQLSFGLHRIWKRMAVNWSGVQRGNRALDLCCGSGDLTYLLAQQVGTTGEAVGVDFSVELLAIAASRKSIAYSPATTQWVEGDVLNLPFESNSFDGATMGYGLRNVVDVGRSLGEIFRVLKPGKAVAILDMHRPVQPWMKQFQNWYLENQVVPAAERCGMIKEYEYIAPSLTRFPQGQEQEELAQSVGFQEAIHYPIAGGMMGCLVAKK
ncbi:MAG: bifunctional demethylmenaquinone methyltransferase/2-methoxy-6-polyprenyl-1,4-benzoquinol methylase UbiE [Cyanobacteria bacterium P01_F01_bin.153]